MNSFALCPLQRGYTPKPGNNILEQALEGGFARQRIGFVNSVHIVEASVLLDTPEKQEYFWAFWRRHQRKKPRPFLWRLIVDHVPMQTYVCQFIAGSLSVGERSSKVYQVSFGLRLKPNYAGHEFDQTIIDAWELGDPYVWANLLERLVNKELPEALGDRYAIFK